MLTRVNASSPPRSLIYGLAATLCLLAPFLLFVTANDYPVLATEAFPFHLAALFAGLLVALLVKIRLVVTARLALWGCLFIAVAFLYDMPAWALVAVAVLSGIAIGLLRDNAATVLAVAAGLHVASTLGISVSGMQTGFPAHTQNRITSTQAASDLPPVLYLVLDEFGGLRGLPDELAGSLPLQSQLTDYYREQGFDLASHAYSRYMATVDSLANLFNFKSGAVKNADVDGADDAAVLAANKFFEQLTKRGYALHIHQSSYLDFCRSPGAAVASCSTYEDNSIASIVDVDIPRKEKTRFIFNSYLDSLAFLRKVRRVYGHIEDRLGVDLPAWPTGNSRVGPLALLSTLDKLGDALRELKPGEFHFAHLLLPHNPYVFDANCSVKPKVGTWLSTLPFETKDPLGDQNTDVSRAERYVAYMAQVHCTNAMLDRLFAAIRESGQWERTIILIHGDHGSRIVRKRLIEANLDRLAEDDFRDAYSTFFAAKHSTSAGRLMAEPRSLQALLADVWNTPVAQPDAQYVYLENAEGTGYVPTPLRGFEPLR